MLRPLIAVGLVVAGLTACSSQQADTPAAAAAPIAPVRDEAAFLKAAREIPDLMAYNPNVTDAGLLQSGNNMCGFIGTPGVTRESLVHDIGTTPIGPRGAGMFVIAIEGHLCPEKRYATPSTSAPVAQALTPAPAAVGPASSISAHDWQLVAKDPASYVGRRIVVYGHVSQFDSGTGTSGFLATVDGVLHRPQYGYANYPTNTALAGDPTALHDVVKGDLFTAEVTVDGLYTYSTTMGGQMSVPKLSITKLTVTGHTTN